MQIKDRHNGNILINNKRLIIHIDFGFILGFCPGGVSFESVPFKLLSEYIELMNGKDSDLYAYFKTLMIRGFLELRKHVEDLSVLLEIMMQNSDLPCFSTFNMKEWKDRFR